MNKEDIKKLIVSQSEINKGDIIERNKYNEIKKQRNNSFIIIISGIRRCGKSTLLNFIRNNEKDKDYYINFDDNRLKKFDNDDFEKLYESFLELYGEQNNFYFDEIQNIIGWERFVRRLHNEGKKVYITGSNASMLSKELGTHLTGRHIQMELYPFSFKEFLLYKKFHFEKKDLYDIKKIVNIKKYFNEYLNKGGIAEFLETNNENYLKTLYENILYRDVMTRYNISDEKTLMDLIYFLMSNIGTRISYNSLRNTLLLSNAITVKEYINYFENSFLLFQVNKFDYSLKKQLINQKKVYVIDTGLANSLSFRFSENLGRMLENVVFIELKNRDKEIYYHSNEVFECDFIMKEKDKIIEAIQVTKTLIENPKTRKREIEGLLDAMNTYNLDEGLILTEDEEETIEIGDERFENGEKGRGKGEGGRGNGENIRKDEKVKKIYVKPIWKWLLE